MRNYLIKLQASVFLRMNCPAASACKFCSRIIGVSRLRMTVSRFHFLSLALNRRGLERTVISSAVPNIWRLG